jgi:ferredoxin
MENSVSNYEKILEAAESCPVSAIAVEDAETGEKIFP